MRLQVRVKIRKKLRGVGQKAQEERKENEKNKKNGWNKDDP